METAFRHVPSLRKSVRTIYHKEQLRKQYDQLRRDNPGLEFWKAKYRLDREVLKPWGKRWNLADDWCLDWVATTKFGGGTAPIKSTQRASRVYGRRLIPIRSCGSTKSWSWCRWGHRLGGLVLSRGYF